MTQRNAEVLQILIRQIAKNAGINVIFRKALSILGHAELLEPVLNLLHREPTISTAAKPNFRPGNTSYTNVSSIDI